jgi:hypothetical protein
LRKPESGSISNGGKTTQKGKTMKAYDVRYKLYNAGEVKIITVLASNKEDAHEIAVYEEIPKKEHEHPYSAWVYGVTHRNGKYQLFNTSEGNPF